MKIEFAKFSDYEKGTMYQLLENAYSFEKKYKRDFQKNWEDVDAFFYGNLEIADSCGFITTVDNKPIGFISWDPRNMPEYAEIGHNCVITEYKGRKIGHAQLAEAIRRITMKTVKCIKVTTDAELIPAQRNYESVGFKVKQIRKNDFNDEYAGNYMDYELIIGE